MNSHPESPAAGDSFVSLEELAETVERMESRLSRDEAVLVRRMWRLYEDLAPRFERDLRASARDVVLAKSAALMLIQAAAKARKGDA